MVPNNIETVEGFFASVAPALKRDF